MTQEIDDEITKINVQLDEIKMLEDHNKLAQEAVNKEYRELIIRKTELLRRKYSIIAAQHYPKSPEKH